MHGTICATDVSILQRDAMLSLFLLPDTKNYSSLFGAVNTSAYYVNRTATCKLAWVQCHCEWKKHFSSKLKQCGETSLYLNPHITKLDSILLPCKSMEEFWKFTISFLCMKAWQQSLHEGRFHDVGSTLVSEYSSRRFSSTKALEKQRPRVSYTFPWDLSAQGYAAIQTPARKYEREQEENRKLLCNF